MRLTARSEQPAADKRLVLILYVAMVAWFVAMGLDRRVHASSVPVAAQVLGLALYLASTAFIMRVFRENSFAAPVVKVQAERGHHVIDTGPYAWVRHPMYSGVSLFFVGAPLLIGSWWGVAMAPLFLLLFAIRVRIEERTLMAGLSGYADYVSRVRYRLVPGIW